MKYEGMIYRPPSEARSLILQVTVGCSYNRCTFCSAYRGKKFRIKKFEEIREDIDEASLSRVPVERVFLADGDALILPRDRLMQILTYLKAQLKRLKRVGIYANARDILNKSPDELKELRKEGLGIVYLGVESGSPEILDRIRKNTSAQELIAAGKRVKASGILLSVTVILGIGGVERSQVHAEETGRILTEMDPDFVGALSLMLVPGTPIEKEVREGSLILPGPFGLIRELETMITHCRLTRGFFASNHASNYLPVRIRMPEQKEEALGRIREILRRGDPDLLKPEYLRAL